MIADAKGNLFGATTAGKSSYCSNGCGTVFEIPKTGGGYATTPNTLVSFNEASDQELTAGLIADANGNLFGTTHGGGSRMEVRCSRSPRPPAATPAPPLPWSASTATMARIRFMPD